MTPHINVANALIAMWQADGSRSACQPPGTNHHETQQT